MWNIGHQFQRIRGFLLLELLLSISLSSILILSFFSILGYSSKTTIIGENYDELLFQGRFTIDYIKEEIYKADRIIATDLINNFNTRYPYNFGFVIMQDLDRYELRSESERKKEKRYRFISYYFNGDEIQRIAINKDSESYPTANQLSGYNYLGNNILSVEESWVDFNNNLIYLSISLGNEEEIHKFKSTIYINCDTDY